MELTNMKDLLEQIKLFKAQQAAEEAQEQQRLEEQYYRLSAKVHTLSNDLNDLYAVLKELDVYCYSGGTCQYEQISYKADGNFVRHFSYTTRYHYLSLDYYPTTGDWKFGNFHLVAGDLELKVDLLQKFLDDYPHFLKRMEREINYKLKYLFKK